MIRSRFGVAMLGLAAWATTAANAQEAGTALTAAQEKRALEIEAANRPPAGLVARGSVGIGLSKLASTFAGRQAKSVTPLVVPLETGAPGKQSNRAVVTRYDYATGITTRTTVDLASGKAVHARHDANYPTPLALEEYDHAIALARSRVPAFDAIFKSTQPADLHINVQMPLYDNSSHPRYGHRLVTLWIEAPTPLGRITVDLSTDEVVQDP
jgi:hypothetical protein